MGQRIQVFPHPGVNRPVAPLHRVPGLHKGASLEHVVGHQKPARRQKPHDIRQPVQILSLGCIHEYKIKIAGKAGKDLPGIAFQQRNPVFGSRPPEILPGDGDPLFKFFNGGNMGSLRHDAGHQKGRIPHGRPHLEDVFWLL